jgi:hypothetical protein
MSGPALVGRGGHLVRTLGKSMTVADVSGCRNAKNERPKNDFFKTPAWVIEQLCDVENIPTRLLDPCARAGAFARVLRRHGHEVDEIDIEPRARTSTLTILSIFKALAALAASLQIRL